MAWLNYTGIWSGFEPAQWFGMGPVSKKKYLLAGAKINLSWGQERFLLETGPIPNHRAGSKPIQIPV